MPLTQEQLARDLENALRNMDPLQRAKGSDKAVSDAEAHTAKMPTPAPAPETPAPTPTPAPQA